MSFKTNISGRVSEGMNNHEGAEDLEGLIDFIKDGVESKINQLSDTVKEKKDSILSSIKSLIDWYNTNVTPSL